MGGGIKVFQNEDETISTANIFEKYMFHSEVDWNKYKKM